MKTGPDLFGDVRRISAGQTVEKLARLSRHAAIRNYPARYELDGSKRAENASKSIERGRLVAVRPAHTNLVF